MKTYIPKKPIVPKDREDDVKKLRYFIIENLGISISTADTYQFWNEVSEAFSASWLSIDFHYEGETREESILELLERFGNIVDFGGTYYGY